MKIEYQKFIPKDLFISFLGREATEEELWLGAQRGVIYNRKTGNEFIDLFAEMVHQYMNHHSGFYAAKLDVTVQDLSGCLKVLSGLSTDEWIAQYCGLVACDLIEHTDWSLGEIARRIGYSSVKSFSRAFIDRIGMPASEWRWKYKK